MGDQLYADVWAPLPTDLPQGLAAQVRALLGRRRLPRAARRLPDARQLRRPRVLERLPAAADPGPAVVGSLSAAAPATALAELYDAYQSCAQPGRQALVLDRRRRRSRSSSPTRARTARATTTRTRALMLEEQWDDLEAWAKNLKGPGVLVLPQPLLKAGGSKTDRTLVDFKESDRLGAIFERALGGHGPARHPDPDRRHPHRAPEQRARSSASRARSTSSSPRRRRSSRRGCRRGATSRPRCPTSSSINNRKWAITGHIRLTPTVDNNVGLIRIAPGRNGRYRFTFQLWRVRPFVGIGKPDLRPQAGQGRAAAPRPDRNRAPLRRNRCSGTLRATHRTRTSWTGRTATATPTTRSSSPTRSRSSSDSDGSALIGLVGSCDLPGVAVRRAQSILRWDRRPSLWSHAFLLVGGGERSARSRCTRAPATSPSRPTTRSRRRRSRTTRARAWTRTSRCSAVRMERRGGRRASSSARPSNPNLERLRYDLFETLGFWQAFLWTRGTPNPLEQGVPEPLVGDGRVLLRGDPARPHAGRQRPQQRARAPVERRALVERRVRRVRPPDRRPLRAARPHCSVLGPGEH